MKKCKTLHIVIYPSESTLKSKIDQVIEENGTYSDYVKSLIYKDIAREMEK